MIEADDSSSRTPASRPGELRPVLRRSLKVPDLDNLVPRLRGLSRHPHRLRTTFEVRDPISVEHQRLWSHRSLRPGRGWSSCARRPTTNVDPYRSTSNSTSDPSAGLAQRRSVLKPHRDSTCPSRRKQPWWELRTPPTGITRRRAISAAACHCRARCSPTGAPSRPNESTRGVRILVERQ